MLTFIFTMRMVMKLFISAQPKSPHPPPPPTVKQTATMPAFLLQRFNMLSKYNNKFDCLIGGGAEFVCAKVFI